MKSLKWIGLGVFIVWFIAVEYRLLFVYACLGKIATNMELQNKLNDRYSEAIDE